MPHFIPHFGCGSGTSTACRQITRASATWSSRSALRIRVAMSGSSSEDNAKTVVGAPDLGPHPFDFAGSPGPKFRFNVVTDLVHGPVASSAIFSRDHTA